MKLSEMTLDQLTQAMCEIADPIERICRDASLNEKIKKLAEQSKNGMMLIEQMGATVAIWIPALMIDHKDDVYKVIGILTDNSAAEIGAMNGFEILNAAKEALTGEVLDFFKLFAGMA